MPRKFLKKFNYWAPVFLWALLIFLFSNKTIPPASNFYWKEFLFKKSAHIFVYGVLAILTYRALLSEGVNKKRAFLIAVLIAIFYGATDEFHQSFTPGREPRIRDIFFDGAGAIIGGYFARMKLS